jgi:hypothetical protein
VRAHFGDMVLFCSAARQLRQLVVSTQSWLKLACCPSGHMLAHSMQVALLYGKQ